MKKPKVKLDAKGIQTLLIDNVEKIGLGLIALICLFMIYRAVTAVDRYHRTPEQLLQEVRKGETAIANTSLKPDLTAKDYVSLAKQVRQPIADGPYVITSPWDPPVFEKKKLRTCPIVFTAEDLRGTADVGAMNMMVAPQDGAAAGGAKAGQQSEPRLQRWIVVTGLVPVDKQERAFADALKKTVFYDGRYDTPWYGDYLVQRLEVPSAADAGELDWTKAERFTFHAEVTKRKSLWPQTQLDVVPSDCIDESLTFPLGPLVGRTWGEAVAHPKDIPLVESTGSQASTKDAVGTPAGNAMPAAPPKDGIGAPGVGTGDHAAGAGRRRGRAAWRGAFDDPAKPKPENNEKEAAKVAEEPKPSAFYLLRFFDYTVEPGKRYVYRFRLALANPNYVAPGSSGGLKASHLKDPAEAQKKWLRTEWSEPTAVISTPLDTRVLADSVNPSREPTGRIVLARWVQRGFEAFHDFVVARGQIGDFVDTVLTHEGRRYLVNFYSGAIPIDFRGGERLPGRGRLTAPSEMLLYLPDGTLVVRSEFDDKPAIDQLKAARAANAEPAATPKTPAAPQRPRGLNSILGAETPKKSTASRMKAH